LRPRLCFGADERERLGDFLYLDLDLDPDLDLAAGEFSWAMAPLPHDLDVRYERVDGELCHGA
jgi:hypothetical protein